MHIDERHAKVATILAAVLGAGLIVVVLHIAWTARVHGPDAKPSLRLTETARAYRSDAKPPSRLTEDSSSSSVKLRRRAAKAFRAMANAAKRDGITLVAVSGIRDLQQQKRTLFGAASEMVQNLRPRSIVCAPFGLKEHRPAYSVSITQRPLLDAKGQPAQGFQHTSAYRWLRRHASRFHFALSTPRQHRQVGISESSFWHYVGDLPSLAAFCRSRSKVAFTTPLPWTQLADHTGEGLWAIE